MGDILEALEQIKNLRKVYFAAFLEAGQVGFPPRGAPDLDAVIETNQHRLSGNLCIGAEGFWDRDSPVDIETIPKWGLPVLMLAGHGSQSW
jgi:hypothetical protein